MSKFIKLLAVFLALISTTARADMPDYEDDAEFLKCRRMNIDSDICQREQIQRALERVKKLYKIILNEPKLVEWNGSLEKDAEVLRDMFESWTAFRNRLCSVSYLATRYVEPIYNEKYSSKRHLKNINTSYSPNDFSNERQIYSQSSRNLVFLIIYLKDNFSLNDIFLQYILYFA